MLIGLCGYARSGKDATGEWLVENREFERLAFADAIRKIAFKIDPWISTSWFRKRRLSWIVERVGYEAAKSYPEFRQFMQNLGQTVRDEIGEDAWIRPVARKAKEAILTGRNVVVTDVRYENEAALIKKLGGVLVSITREGVGPANKHASELGIPFYMCSFEIDNSSTLESLYNRVEAIYNSVLAADGHDLQIGDRYSHEVMLRRWQDTQARCLHNAVQTILDCAAPTNEGVDEWMSRHRLETESSDDGVVSVIVDGDLAGEVAVDDEVVQISVYMAR